MAVLVHQSTLLVLLLINGFDTMCQFMLVPFLPFLVSDLKGSPFELGIMGSCFALCQMLGGVFWGALSDKISRKIVICMTVLGNVFGFFAFSQNRSLYPLIVLRSAQGFFAGGGAVANAFLQDCTTGDDRTQWIAFSQLAGAVGMLVGPLMGIIFDDYGVFGLCKVAAGLALLSFICGVVALGEPPRQLSQNGQETAAGFGLDAFYELRANLTKIILALAVIGFLDDLTLSVWAYGCIVFWKKYLGATEKDAAMFLIVLSLGIIAMSAGIGPYLVKARGARWNIVVGFAARIVAFAVCFALPLGKASIWICTLILGTIGFNIGLPERKLLADAVPDHCRGVLNGFGMSARFAAQFLGPFLSGALSEVNLSLPIFAMIVVCAASAVFAASILPDAIEGETVPIARPLNRTNSQELIKMYKREATNLVMPGRNRKDSKVQHRNSSSGQIEPNSSFAIGEPNGNSAEPTALSLSHEE